ncbi:MAG TPA: heavy metal sensor histidine kinase [Candidatus Acidoferrum sp.]|nr:heavy metal sensor histidine kinase [Candidatus Acidoferrum sp.]
MLNSVRIRLTLWHAGAVACVLLILASGTYLLLRRNSIRRVDSSLTDVASSFLATVQAELRDAHGSETFRDCVEAAIQEHSYRETTFSIFDAQGKLILASPVSPPLLESEASRYDALRQQATSNAAPARLFRTLKASGHLYRGYSRAFSAEGTTYTLVTLQSLHGEQEFLEALEQTYSVAIPLAVLLAALGGYFLARRSLSPVVVMSNQAERIGANNMQDRLAVRNTRDELGQLALSFNRLLDRLDESFQHQRRFVADASHELRTPVAILAGEADVALSKKDRTPEEYRESLEILRKEALRLKQIVEDLFTLTRADIGQLPLTPSSFYLDELVGDCVRNFRTLAQAKQIALTFTPCPELLIVADEALLRRMFLNILDNAIKYTPAGGAVTVSCERTVEEYVVSFSDNGPGIPAALQPRIFERFFRADESRGRQDSARGGAGLGLAICRWIAEAHHGRLELTKSDAGGSTFTFTLLAPDTGLSESSD